ncbi:hypothetical protein [Staphylococcus haemolyticus]|uniref:hypothetical protein n=1 Tax=Staphylococcus haemolyticus TaxID=1283 RepID=UPI001F0A4F96|nr:hypothetical protein [Staphylococcus haemolyticus]MCH4503446.1 hypothetical protein [Staphylococcus haemolyticus]MCH4510559.1 hypothetical protein [Staphylococcus haemolyticus]MCH4530692.1 hypothetical protein [Staphylococcus haemolyticus]
MRKQIEELLNSEVTGYRIAKKTGIGESVISNLRSGKRNLDNISLKNAELLAQFKNDWDLYTNAKQIEVDPESEIEFVESLYTNYSMINTNNENNGYFISFESINKVEVNDKELFEIEFKYADEIEIEEDYFKDEVERAIWDNEEVEDRIFFKKYEEALSYLKMRYDIFTLEEVIGTK